MEQDYKEEENVTKVWVEYQKGVMFNRSHNLYTDTDKNYNFYHGNQWEGAKLGDIQPVVFNIIKYFEKYKLELIRETPYQSVLNS